MILKELKNNKNHIKEIFIGIISYFIALITIFCGGLLWEFDVNNLISLVILSGIGCALLVFYFIQENINDNLIFENGTYYFRFIIGFFVCLVFAILFPFLPVTAWFYPVIAVALMFCSNRLISFITTTFLLILSLQFSNNSISIFILFFVCIVAVLFSFNFHENKFKIGKSIFIASCAQLCMICAMIIIFSNSKMSIDLFIIPITNLLLSIILFLIILKQFSVLIIYRDYSKYMIINDQAYELMVEFKKKNLKLYLKSIHIAHLVDGISKVIKLDQGLLKAVAYYQYIDCIREGDKIENLNNIFKEHKFPVKCKNLIMDIVKDKGIISKEMSVVYISTEIIEEILEKQQNKSELDTLDYDMIINKKISDLYLMRKFRDSNLTAGELYLIENVLKKEGIYYDFLY